MINSYPGLWISETKLERPQAKIIVHAHFTCHAITLAIARDGTRDDLVTHIACARCLMGQRCVATVFGGGLHGAAGTWATRLTPVGWRCAACADAEAWPVGPGGW